MSWTLNNCNEPVNRRVKAIQDCKDAILRDYPLGIDCDAHYNEIVGSFAPDQCLDNLIDIYLCIHETCEGELLEYIRGRLSSSHTIDFYNLRSRIPPQIFTKLYPLDCFKVETKGTKITVTNTLTGKVSNDYMYCRGDSRDGISFQCFHFCVVVYTKTIPFIFYPYGKYTSVFSGKDAINDKCLCVVDNLTFVVGKPLSSSQKDKVKLYVFDYETKYDENIFLSDLVNQTDGTYTPAITSKDSIEIVGANTVKRTCTVRINGKIYIWHYPAIVCYHLMD